MSTAELFTNKGITGVSRAVSLAYDGVMDIQEVLFEMQKSVGKDTSLHNFQYNEISKEHYDFFMGEE